MRNSSFLMLCLAALSSLCILAVLSLPASSLDNLDSLVAEAALVEGEYDKALSLVEDALWEDWADAEAHEIRGRVFQAMEQFRNALASYERAEVILSSRLALLPADAPEAEPLRKVLRRVCGRLALLAKDLPVPEEGFYWAEEAYFLGSIDPAVLEVAGEGYLNRRRYDKAKLVLDEALFSLRGDTPEDLAARIFHLRGAANYYLGHSGAAIADYVAAERRGLATVDLFGNWAFALEGLERWEDALAMWERVAEMDVPTENESMVEEHLNLCREKLGMAPLPS